MKIMESGLTKQQAVAVFVILLFGGSAVAYALVMAFPEIGEGPGIQAQAFLEVRICGEDVEIQPFTAETDHGNISMDDDNMVTFPHEETTLGHIFDGMNKTFSRTELMGYENNNMCNTTWSNEVSVSRGRFIEGREDIPVNRIDQYREYSLEHGDHVIVRYD